MPANGSHGEKRGQQAELIADHALFRQRPAW